MDEKRGQILDQAIALADERGLAAVSMRSVAERLGLSSMAIYPYVGNKEALLDGMVDRLLGELSPAAAVGAWPDRLRAVAHAVRGLARRHPGAYQLIMARPSATPDARRLDELLYGILRDAGVPEADVPRLERLLSTLVLGFAASEVNGRFTATADRGGEVDWDAEFEADLDDGIRLVEQAVDRPPAGDLASGRA
jgi:AcrR family transcriptional regulator